MIPLFKFRMLFGVDQGIDNLDKKRLQITSWVGNSNVGIEPGLVYVKAATVVMKDFIH